MKGKRKEIVEERIVDSNGGVVRPQISSPHQTHSSDGDDFSTAMAYPGLYPQLKQQAWEDNGARHVVNFYPDGGGDGRGVGGGSGGKSEGGGRGGVSDMKRTNVRTEAASRGRVSVVGGVSKEDVSGRSQHSSSQLLKLLTGQEPVHVKEMEGEELINGSDSAVPRGYHINPQSHTPIQVKDESVNNERPQSVLLRANSVIRRKSPLATNASKAQDQAYNPQVPFVSTTTEEVVKPSAPYKEFLVSDIKRVNSYTGLGKRRVGLGQNKETPSKKKQHGKGATPSGWDDVVGGVEGVAQRTIEGAFGLAARISPRSVIGAGGDRSGRESASRPGVVKRGSTVSSKSPSWLHRLMDRLP